MSGLPAELSQAIDRLGSKGLDSDRLTTTTRRLIDRYQADRPAVPGQPIMAGDQEAAAYAVYRMPATYTAIRAVLDQLPDQAARSGAVHLDIAGGTGAAVWAVSDRWPDVSKHIVLEQSEAAIRLGRRLTGAGSDPVRQTDWQRQVINSGLDLPASDVITVGYLLSEIDEQLRASLINSALAAARDLLIIVEPGTKNGYRRVLQARDQVIRAGWQIVAPCPHHVDCPLAGQQTDWCHFSARLNRSTMHRRVKGGELGYEDEKFSYLAASPKPLGRAAGRVLRHPSFPKGRVELVVCQGSGAAERVTVAKREQDLYRAARKIEWGDPWP